MPRAVTHDSLPYTALAVIVKAVDKSLIARRSRVLCRFQDVNDPCSRTVKVPNVDFAVVGARVDVPPICALGRREVAANESFEDTMSAESDQGAVMRMWFV